MSVIFEYDEIDRRPRKDTIWWMRKEDVIATGTNRGGNCLEPFNFQLDATESRLVKGSRIRSCRMTARRFQIQKIISAVWFCQVTFLCIIYHRSTSTTTTAGLEGFQPCILCYIESLERTKYPGWHPDNSSYCSHFFWSYVACLD